MIAASLLSSEPSLRLYLSDADALAVRAAKINVPEAEAVVLSDCWDALPAKPKKFNWIVSNPPVHLGIQTDFRVLRTLIAGASKRLKPGGQLWLVTQTYVPVGALIAKQKPRVSCANGTRITRMGGSRSGGRSAPRSRARRTGSASEVKAVLNRARTRRPRRVRSRGMYDVLCRVEFRCCFSLQNDIFDLHISLTLT